jgi:hypothetical protein
VSTVGQEGVLRPARFRLGSLSAAQRRFQTAGEILSRDCPLIAAWGFVAALWLFGGGGFAADSWLTLLGGREIVAHGLPHHDSWAILSHGHQWIDQQWLAQLFYYGFYKLGGLGLVGRINVLLFASAGLIALIAARRRGASPTRVLICAVPALLLMPSFIRAQVLSELLFVIVLILLVQESRRPSRRVFLVFPLIALWANLHGAAVMGAAMVSLLGMFELYGSARSSRRGTGRGLLLALGAWPCLLMTPYGLGVLPYYRATLENPAFAKYITEWQSPHPLTLWGATFFLTALFAGVVVVRRIRDFNLFELAILLFTFAGGLLAVRSVVWFVCAVLVLVPRALEGLWPARHKPGARQFVPLRAALATLPLVLCLVFVARQQTNVEQLWPAGASRSVATAARNDPSVRIFANEEYADWLLFREPQLRGRLAFDGRWEILRPDQMSAVVDFLFKRTPKWERVARGYGLFVLNPKTNRRVDETFSGRVDMHVVYRDKRVVVFERRPSA